MYPYSSVYVRIHTTGDNVTDLSAMIIIMTMVLYAFCPHNAFSLHNATLSKRSLPLLLNKSTGVSARCNLIAGTKNLSNGSSGIFGRDAHHLLTDSASLKCSVAIREEFGGIFHKGIQE